MKRFWLPFCIALIVAACLPGYGAIPSYRGYTGLIIIPTADALGKAEWNAGFFYEDVASGTVNDVVANYGIIQGLEFGVDRFRRSDENDHQTLLNAKYRFLPETFSHPAIAAGIIDITDEIDTTVYAVASKSFGCDYRVWQGEVLSPRVTVGFAGGGVSGLFGGVSLYIGNRVAFMGEWTGHEVNAGIRVRVTPQFTIHAAGLNLTDQDHEFNTPGPAFGVGASYGVTY